MIIELPNRVPSISPSVYVAYTALRANYHCDLWNGLALPTVAGSEYRTTIAYPPGALSTYAGPQVFPVFTILVDPVLNGSDDGGKIIGHSEPIPASWFQAINYTQLQVYGITASNSTIDYSTYPYRRTIGGPNLKIPEDLRSLNSQWRMCALERYGLLDPPRVLTKATAIATPTTESSPWSTANLPAPASGIASTHLPPISTPPPSAHTTEPSLLSPTSDTAEGSATMPFATNNQRSTDKGYPLAQSIVHNGDPKATSNFPASQKGGTAVHEDTMLTSGGGNQLHGTRTDNAVDPTLLLSSSVQPFEPSQESESTQDGATLDNFRKSAN